MKYLNDVKDINPLDKFTVMIDDEDYDRLSKYTWRFNSRTISRYYTVKNRKYAQGRQCVMISLSNEVMNRQDVMFDHIDRNPLNNQKSNLREATKAQNARNNTKSKYTECKYKGVYFEKSRDKFKCAIRFNGKLIHLGYFSSEIEAAKMYDLKAKEFFKEFASLNFPHAP